MAHTLVSVLFIKLSSQKCSTKKNIESNLIIEKDCEFIMTLDNTELPVNCLHFFDGITLIYNKPTAVISKMECSEDLAKYQVSQSEKALQIQVE